MIHRLYSSLCRGHTKDVLGPVVSGCGPAVIFDFVDSYTLASWGKVVDQIPQKGEAYSVLSGTFFEKLARPELWKEYSRSKEALSLRKASRYGAIFNEIAEDFQMKGLKSHYLGSLNIVEGAASQLGSVILPQPLSLIEKPTRFHLARQIFSKRPDIATVLGEALPDYQTVRSLSTPRLIPAQVQFQFVSAISDFPELRLFTVLESAERSLSLAEALAMGGLSAKQLQEMLLMSVWVAALLRWICQSAGIVLAQGRFQWALDEKGCCLLTDTLGWDELEFQKSEMPLSLDFLAKQYHATAWYSGLQHVQSLAKEKGISDWRKHVTESPPPLSEQQKLFASQLCMALANRLTGKTWFPEALSLDEVIEDVEDLKNITPIETRTS